MSAKLVIDEQPRNPPPSNGRDLGYRAQLRLARRIPIERPLPGRALTLAATLITGLVLLATPPPAAAATTCAFAGSTATVSMSAAGDTGSIAVGTAGRIMLASAQCGTATTANTDTIVVNGNTGAETLTIDLSGGAFEPGLTAEGTGTSEIEFSLDLGTGVLDRITITGGPGNEAITFGTSGMALNGDSDVDATVTGVELGTVNASAGADTVSGAGGGTGGSPVVASADVERRQRRRQPHRR